MKVLYPLFDVGMELEFFLIKRGATETKVLNARELAKKRLGFSIDQRDGSGMIMLDDNQTSIRTDGTCFELQVFQKHAPGKMPTIPWDKVRNVKALFGSNVAEDLVRWPFVKAGDNAPYSKSKIVFDNPGGVYGSGKEIINAYSGERHWGKKEDEKLVDFRTAGLHLHFSLSSLAIPGKYDHHSIAHESEMIMGSFKHTCELVKLADIAFDAVFAESRLGCLDDSSKMRQEKYQKRGDYRVYCGRTETGLKTLEYRQLDCSMYQPHKLNEFLVFFNALAMRYISEEIN